MTSGEVKAVALPSKAGHGKCSRHWVYDLSCDDFDDLRHRASDRCEICRVAGARTISDRELAYLAVPFWASDALKMAREERAAAGIVLHRLAQRTGAADPRRTVRFEDKLWDALRPAAMANGHDRAGLIAQFVRWYLRVPGASLPARPPARREEP